MVPPDPVPDIPARPIQLAALLGAAVRTGFARLGSLFWVLGTALGTALRLRGEQLRVVLEVTRQQIRFTALDALPLCVVMALLLGAITLLQAFGQLSGYAAERTLSRLLAQLVIRELGPLMVGILVIARSGTAVATELANRKLSGELGALWASGVDPFGYVLVPRLLGGVVSMFALVIVFDAVALLGGFLVASLRLPLSFSAFLEALGAAIGPRELAATFGKSLVFGAGIPLLCAFWGVRVRRSTTEIPQAVTRAAVGSLLVLVLAGALLSVVIYG
jgi:phospholipid/cholesterol/gamma-HCH transport system permease protein